MWIRVDDEAAKSKGLRGAVEVWACISHTIAKWDAQYARGWFAYSNRGGRRQLIRSGGKDSLVWTAARAAVEFLGADANVDGLPDVPAA